MSGDGPQMSAERVDEGQATVSALAYMRSPGSTSCTSASLVLPVR